MARSVAEINDYMVTALVSNFAAIGITINPLLWSKRSLLRAFIFTVAIGQALVEQLQDAFMEDIEAIVAVSAAASYGWIQAKMFLFQYSATNPQFVTLINTIPVYPIVDSSLTIINACSVTSDLSNTVSVKCAKGSPLQALDALEIASAQGYINTIGTAGIEYKIISLNADRLYIEGDLYYQGQYASVIQANTIAAIELWLESLSVINFNGKIKMSDLEKEIRNIPGMNDVVLRNVRARPEAVAFASGIDLISDTKIIERQYSTAAGYVIPEDTVTKTLIDSLNFIVE